MKLYANTIYLDNTSSSLSLNDFMSERSRNCLEDSSVLKQMKTEPCKETCYHHSF